MNNILLESERLLIKPLCITELLYIKNSNMNALEVPVLSTALSEDVLSAIAKKIEKMQYIEKNLHQWYTYWLIIDKNIGNGIGFVGFKGIKENGYAEVGYSISPDYRKRGLMTEALKALINWASASRKLKGITAKVNKTNTGSLKVLNNCSFEYTGFSGNEKYYRLKFI